MCLHLTRTHGARLTKGCEGGQPFAAMEYAEKKGGLVPESCLPYLKSEGGPMGTCDDEPCLKFQKTPKCPKDILRRNPECADGSGKRWSDVALPLMSQHILQLSTPMAMEIMTYGPIVASMSVYDDLLNYTGGVYRQQSDKLVGAHAVKIIGWGSTPEPYWLVQNSWTSRWGEEGFFRIRRGDDYCECGICNLAVAGRFYGNHSGLA